MAISILQAQRISRVPRDLHRDRSSVGGLGPDNFRVVRVAQPREASGADPGSSWHFAIRTPKTVSGPPPGSRAGPRAGREVAGRKTSYHSPVTPKTIRTLP